VETAEQTGRDVLICEVDGRRVDPHTEWTRLAMGPITKETYDFMVADAAHARRYRPGDPKANPRKAIDLSKAPAPRNPKMKV
jgi:hypothetical protein